MDNQRVCKHILFFASHNAIALKNKKSLQANPPDRADIVVNLTLQTFGLRRRTTGNIGLPQWGLTCFYDSLVLNQSSVLRLNISAKNPPLRQAPTVVAHFRKRFTQITENLMNSELNSKLKLWDGVHTEYLTELYGLNSSSLDFFEILVTICVNDQDLQKPATWLIKHHYDNGQKLPASLTERLLTTCKTVENWEAKLHLLQLLPYFKLTNKSIIITEDFTRKCLENNNKFVRAWAYNGLYELTKYIPELTTELEFICQRAMETETAAIKSKVKKILLAINKRRK